jgi:U4/U6 small nuclear ribonucleoprotein PRP4
MDPMDEDNGNIPGPDAGNIKYGQINTLNTADLLQAGIAAGNIYRQTAGDVEVMELPEASRAHLDEHMAKVEQLELRRQMKNIVVPVLDSEVRTLLRQMGEPITLFGEKEMERRERLRKLLATMSDDQAQLLAVAAEEAQQPLATLPPPKELFYTEGSEELKAARIQIAQWSLQRASARIAAEKQHRETSNKEEETQAAEHLEQSLRSIVNQTSEVGDERPVSSCQFSSDGELLVTGSWSGNIKVWSMPACTTKLTIKAHPDRVTGIAVHPSATAANAMDCGLAIASGSSDRTAKLWSADGKLIRTLEGHTDRLGRVAFHPLGRHLGTASFDMTWRMWDIETGACLLEQEGHSRAVYSVAFQKDGALAASAGMDAFGRIWDLRTGKSVMLLEGHIKGVLAVDFSPNGYHVATGSEDHTSRVFDLRKKESIAVLPGHNSLVSQVRFDPVAGKYLLTSGYDNVSKIWCGKKFRLTKTLAGHEGKVMCSDINPVGNHVIATGGYDRTLKLWSPDEFAVGNNMMN